MLRPYMRIRTAAVLFAAERFGTENRVLRLRATFGRTTLRMTPGHPDTNRR